jgi:hypothetical protein
MEKKYVFFHKKFRETSNSTEQDKQQFGCNTSLEILAVMIQ